MLACFSPSFVFSQISTPLPSAAKDDPASTLTSRGNQLISEILRDIGTERPRDQAKDLTELGSTIWDTDKKQGITFLTRGVDIALDPATPYANEVVRGDALRSILYLTRLIDKDEVLANRLISRIRTDLSKRTDKNSPDYNADLISLADYLVEKREKQAFDLAMLSLNGKHPAVDYNATRFFGALKRKNEPLSIIYFAKMIEAVRDSQDPKLLNELIVRSTFSAFFDNYDDRFQVSDPQKKAVLETMVPFVVLEADELSTNQRTDCYLASGHGRRLLPDFKRLEPPLAEVIERAVNGCQNSGIDPMKKPDKLLGRKLKTCQDYLDFAATIPDKQLRNGYISWAAHVAHQEKNYTLAIRILDDIDESSRPWSWDWDRKQEASALIAELITGQRFADVYSVLEATPQRLRPYVVTGLGEFYWMSFGRNHRLEALKLLNYAKAEFAKMDFPVPTKMGSSSPINPSNMVRLVDSYSNAGFREEVLGTFEEFVALQNQLTTKYVGVDPNGFPIAYSAFALSKQFIEANFEAVSRNVGSIESRRIRINFRLLVLWQIVHNGAIGSEGVTGIG